MPPTNQTTIIFGCRKELSLAINIGSKFWFTFKILVDNLSAVVGGPGRYWL